MEQMTMKEISAAIGCEGTFSGQIDWISTDSRDLPEGCLFIALVGERFNGHDFVDAALRAGARYAIVQENRAYEHPERILTVKDTQQALMQIGRAYRQRYQIRCIGVTGSVGKTTTKEMIAQVVGAGYKTLKTEGNLNNEIGLPKTLLRLDGTYEAAVIEMGMRGLGEIDALAKIALPDIGVITNIGISHIDLLGSRENICKAKLELAKALPDAATLILNGDDDMLCKVKMPRLDVQFYGIENRRCDFTAQNIQEQDGKTYFTLHTICGTAPVVLPSIGRHHVRNALAACAVGRAMGISLQACAKALEGYQPSGMRQRVRSWNGCTVVEDCYNASPDSMHAAIETLADFACEGKRIAVLADMLELGAYSEQAHREIGRFAAQRGVDLLLAFGDEAEFLVEEAKKEGAQALHFASKKKLLDALRKRMAPSDVIWVKGSRGMALEEVLQGLYEGEKEDAN